MATTITAENAKQFRKSMDIYVTMQVAGTATITGRTVSGTYKSYDSTLGETAWNMRQLADLSGDGFPLDGSAQWYDSSVTPSANNGKLGLRGNVGGTVTVQITASSTLTAITIADNANGTISVGNVTYTATGMDVVTINARTATLVFTPADANSRVEIDYIVPGLTINATNDNIVSCELSLRSNLEITDHTWEESDITVQLYYPNDIASSLVYVQNDWPITYQAGYGTDLSEERKFYLSESITWKDNLITIRGVDASHKLEQTKLPDRILQATPATANAMMFWNFKNALTKAGISYRSYGSDSYTSNDQAQFIVVPESSARDFVSELMNLTISHKRNGQSLGMQYVDAGIPTVEFGDGKHWGRTWNLNKSECGEWEESYDRNIGEIVSNNAERKFAENLSHVRMPEDSEKPLTMFSLIDAIKPEAGTIYTNEFDDYYYRPQYIYKYCTIETIELTPKRSVFKCLTRTQPVGAPLINGVWIYVELIKRNGGTNRYSNPSNVPGDRYEVEPFVIGSMTDGYHEIINYPSLFDRSLRHGSFVWKGDPRMQPLDYLNITDDTVSGGATISARVEGIDLKHEGGGTQARIEWREWS